MIQAALFLATLLFGVHYYLTSTFGYWKQRGMPYVKPEIFFGSFRELLTFKLTMGKAYENIYQCFKARGHKFVGAYVGRGPVLIPIDLDLIKFVLTKGFNNFVDRANAPTLEHVYLQHHLFNMEGDQWREMRKKLSPTFTSGKMKKMFLLMETCASHLEEEVSKMVREKSVTVNCKDVIARFTSDIIASCAYGLEVNSIRDRNNEFYHMTQRMFVSSRLRIWKKQMLNLFPKIFNLLRMTMTDKQIQRYLPDLVQATIEHREKNNISRNDFLDLLLRIKHNKSLEDDKMTDDVEYDKEDKKNEQGLTFEEICSQTFLFFGAGFETAASTLTFCLYELSRRPGLQQRLREEVIQALRPSGGRVTYEAVHQMAYMEQVVNETLRLYASLPLLTRRCVRPVRLPDTDLTLERGVRVIVPAYAVHHDPEIYPDPDRFDPERFGEDAVAARHPYAHLPFGEGPRMCIGRCDTLAAAVYTFQLGRCKPFDIVAIGIRFGKVQVKVGLATLLPKFRFSLPPETPQPLPISPASALTAPACPVMLTISPVRVTE